MEIRDDDWIVTLEPALSSLKKLTVSISGEITGTWDLIYKLDPKKGSLTLEEATATLVYEWNTPQEWLRERLNWNVTLWDPVNEMRIIQR